MASLLRDKEVLDRQHLIEAISAHVELSLDPTMREGGRFSFPQEAYVATSRRAA